MTGRFPGDETKYAGAPSHEDVMPGFLDPSKRRQAWALALVGWATSLFVVVLGSQASLVLWVFTASAAVIFAGLYVLSAALLVAGGLLFLRLKTTLAAFLNLLAGFIMLDLYFYYEYFSTPIFTQFGVLNLALFVPAFIVAIVSLLGVRRST